MKRDRVPFTITRMVSGGCTVSYDRLPEKPQARAAIRLPLPLLADLKREAKRRGVDRDALEREKEWLTTGAGSSNGAIAVAIAQMHAAI